MAGTKEGGLKAAARNKELYGEDFYKKLGAVGGAKGRTGGFFANRELAREAGMKGGRKSRRTGGSNKQTLLELKIGDTLFFPDESAPTVRARLNTMSRKLGIRISVVYQGNGTLVTRVD